MSAQVATLNARWSSPVRRGSKPDCPAPTCCTTANTGRPGDAHYDGPAVLAVLSESLLHPEHGLVLSALRLTSVTVRAAWWSPMRSAMRTRTCSTPPSAPRCSRGRMRLTFIDISPTAGPTCSRSRTTPRGNARRRCRSRPHRPPGPPGRVARRLQHDPRSSHRARLYDGFVTDFGRILSLFFRDPEGLEGEVCVPNPNAKPGVTNPPGTPAVGYAVVDRPEG